jgi:hypothetical protein
LPVGEAERWTDKQAVRADTLSIGLASSLAGSQHTLKK